MDKPTIGRIVHYTLSENDAAQINRRRTTSTSIAERIGQEKWPLGAQAHIGNYVSPGDVVPMLICRVWEGDAHGVNGQAFLDGNDVLWVTSASHGEALGQWSWPQRS